MAIKKGAFAQYTQERQLPEKKSVAQIKTSHFFDDISQETINSLPVHNQSINSTEKVTEISGNQPNPEQINSSQLVHNSCANQDKESRINAYGQTNIRNYSSEKSVHNQFTNDTKQATESLTNNYVHEQINGSQSVHNSCEQQEKKSEINTDGRINKEKHSSSYSVHDQFTYDAEQVKESSDGQSDYEQINGSQSVHKLCENQEKESGKNDYGRTNMEKDSSLESSQNLSINLSKSIVKDNRENDSTSYIALVKFERLIGNQREIVLAFYKNMYMNNSLTTKELTLDEIAMMTGVNKKSLKNTLFRLTSNGYIVRSDQKIGRGGWVKYRLNPALQDEIKNIGIMSAIKRNKKC